MEMNSQLQTPTALPPLDMRPDGPHYYSGCVGEEKNSQLCQESIHSSPTFSLFTILYLLSFPG